MTTAYTSLLGLALPVTGELSGTWGSVVNDSITSLLDSAVAGTTNVSTDADVTLTTTTGAANTAREAILLFSGARTALRTVTAPAQSKVYTVINATTGGYSVKLVGAGPTTGLTIPNGASAVVAWNGSDFVEVGSGSIGNLTVNGTLTVTGATTLQSTLAVTGNITNTAGTANGVTYLNGSKVLTSGSGLVFDGTNLGVGASPSGNSFFEAVSAGAQKNILQAWYGSGNNLPFVVATDNSNGYAYLGWNTKQGAASAQTYLVNNYANKLEVSSGQFRFYNAANGTAGNAITFTQAMTLDASGNLGIGTTNPAAYGKLAVNGSANVLNGNFLYMWDSGNTNAPGMYAPGDAFAWKNSAGSTEWMRINSTGLGIGTSSPSQKLEVAGNMYINTSGNPNLTIKTSGAGNNPYINLTGGSNTWTFQGTFSNTNTPLIFQYNSSSLLTLDNAGNLGLGVTPSAWGSGQKAIQVGAYAALWYNSGFTRLASNVYDNGTNVFYLNTAAASYYQQNAGAHAWFNAPSGTVGAVASFTQAMTLDASGNLGVGTTSPGAKLEIGGTNPEIRLGPVSSSSGAYMSYNTAGNYFSLNAVTQGVGYRNICFATDGGYVGIATTSPTTLLSLAGSTSTPFGLSITASGWNNARHRLTVPSSGDTSVWSFNYNGSSVDFASYGTSAISVSSGVLVFGTGTNNTAPSERARIDSSGNLFVGTTSTTTIPSLGKGVYLGSSTNNDIIGYSMYINEGANNRRGSMFLNDSTGVWGFDATASSGVPIYAFYRAGNEYFTVGDEIVVNNVGGDIDFRVESDANSNAIFMNAQYSSVGINTDAGGNSTLLVLDSNSASGNNISVLGVSAPNENKMSTIVSGGTSAQGTANWITVVKLCPSVSSNNKLIIPFVSQGSLNSNTVCRVMGHNAAYNTSTPYGFEITFTVGHLSAMYAFSYWGAGGNAVSAALNGQTVEITFSTAYNVAYGVSGGVYVTLQYMTNIPSYSIDISNIRLN